MGSSSSRGSIVPVSSLVAPDAFGTDVLTLPDPLVVRFIMNPALSKVADPDPATFVVRSLWNNTHL